MYIVNGFIYIGAAVVLLIFHMQGKDCFMFVLLRKEIITALVRADTS